MTTARWLIALAVMAAIAAVALHVASLRSKLADMKVQVADLEESVQARDARIAGLELTVKVRDQELAAVNQQVEDTLEATDTMRRRLWEIDEILVTATTIAAQPGDITDDTTNRTVVRHLNKLLPPVVRDSTSAPGNHRAATGENLSVPQAGK